MSQYPNPNPRQSAEQPPQQPAQRPPTQPPAPQTPPANSQPPQSFQPAGHGQPGPVPQGQPSNPGFQQAGPVGQQPIQSGQPAQQFSQQPSQAGQPAKQFGQQPVQVGQPAKQFGQQPVQAGHPAQATPAGQAVQQQAFAPQRQASRSYLATVSLAEIIREGVVTAEPDTPVPTLTSQMKQDGVGSVIIVQNGELQGIVTDRQVALSLEEMPDLSDRTAEEIMSDQLIAGDETMSLHDALQLLRQENIRRLPITDENNSLVGIVTLDDILVFLGEELQHTTDIIKAQSPRL